MNSSIALFWEKLKIVQSATFRCKKEDDWQGFATVSVTLQKNQTILFKEKGEWENKNLSFTNTLRWIFCSDTISLEHLRFGFRSPVQLVHLAPTIYNDLHSINPYLCGQDHYSARVFWNQEGIHLLWSVRGPLKNEEIYTHYQ